MADVKISALPASTTPLAGTEVLPIVQSGATVQVSVANLTAGRAVSALSLTSTTTLDITGTSTLSGNAIISVTDNTNAALRITQLGTGNALLVEDSTNPDATPFVIDATGRVLLGATSTTGNAGLQIWGVDAFAQQHIRRYSNDTLGATLAVFKARGDVTTSSIVQSGDTLGTLSFNGHDGSTTLPTATLTAATIVAAVDGTPGTNDMPGRLIFSTTADGAATPTERMRIDSSGNVGIGGSAAAYTRVDATGSYPTSIATTIVYNATGTVPSGTTGTARVYGTSISIAASTTVGSVQHFYAQSPGLFSGAAITNQYGFLAESNLTSATNNFGFYGNIASGTNRYNLYMAGTADNFFTGKVSTNSFVTAFAATTTPAGGTANTGYNMGSAGVGIIWGSGAPTATMPAGSIYLRTDGGVSSRIYSTSGGGTWLAITSL